MAGQKRRGSFKRRKLGPGNKIGSVIIFVVAFMALMASVIRIITIRQDQAVYDEKEAYYTQLVEEETKRAEELVEFEKYTQTTAYIEEVAKSRFGLVKDGEIIFVAK